MSYRIYGDIGGRTWGHSIKCSEVKDAGSSVNVIEKSSRALCAFVSIIRTCYAVPSKPRTFNTFPFLVGPEISCGTGSASVFLSVCIWIISQSTCWIRTISERFIAANVLVLLYISCCCTSWANRSSTGNTSIAVVWKIITRRTGIIFKKKGSCTSRTSSVRVPGSAVGNNVIAFVSSRLCDSERTSSNISVISTFGARIFTVTS